MKPYLLFLLPLAVHASESDLACNLERSKAEVQASTLAAPFVYGTLGQDPLTTSKSAVTGVSQSFSGRVQASKLREAAEARCDMLYSTMKLEEHGRWAQAQVQHEAALNELRVVEEAIELAKTNIAELDAQLSAKTITIAQHTEARQTLVTFEARRAELLRQLAVVLGTPVNTNIASLVGAARAAEGRAARLTAQAIANSAWDISMQAGVRQPLDGTKANTYGNITFRWSFGAPASARAATAVGEQTEILSAAQQGGYTQTVQRDTLIGLIQSETAAASTVARQITHLDDVRASLRGIDTVLALNMRRSLELQLKALEADQAGAETRLAGYKALLEKLQ